MKRLFLMFCTICALAGCRKETENKVNADFLVYDTLLKVGENVALKNLSDSISTYYLWDFGDGFSSNESCPFHSYEKPGNYTIKLIVRDNYITASDTSYQKVRVGECLVYQIVLNNVNEHKRYPDDTMDWDADSTGISALPDVFISIKESNMSPSYESKTLYNLDPAYLPKTFEIPDIAIKLGVTGIYLKDRDGSDSETIFSNTVSGTLSYAYDKVKHQGDYTFNNLDNALTVRYKVK
ncbi:MAG: PKD domain-containing protein [Lentimicrobium sp.]|jgi:PKD repeat protein|nr:PKD domain-containing protein [Lentimicrobium sp.]